MTAGQNRVMTIPAHNLNLGSGLQANTIADTGTGVAIPVTASGECAVAIGGGAETNTLAIPTFAGQVIVLTVASIGAGTRAITVAAAINQAGNTLITLNTAADTIELHAVTVGGALRWRVAFNDGALLG